MECHGEGGMSTLITGNDENVIDYIQCVEGIDVSETQEQDAPKSLPTT